MNNHEDFSRREGPEGSSDRTLGMVFAAFFLVFGISPLLRANVPRWWSIGASGTLLFVALACPVVLHPINILWTRLAVLLNRIVNPIITGLMFYLVFTPVGILMRLCGKNPLVLNFESDKDTYWIERRPPGPPPETMAQQF